MSPTHLPASGKNRHRRIRLKQLFANPLTAATAISFSLTFVGAGVALLLGLVPESLSFGGMALDTGVVLLIVPLSALMLAILFEATIAIFRDSSGPAAADHHRLGAWKPGEGEG